MYSTALQNTINDAVKKQAYIDTVGEDFASIVSGDRDKQYTQWEIQCAFDMVADKEHWKNPICADIPAEDVDITSYSVTHMTACVPDVTPTGNKVRIEAPGYYAVVGS